MRPDAPSTLRRALVGAVAAAALLAGPVAREAIAQTAYPTKPITLIIPFPPGGATDNQFRALAQTASKDLGQPIVIVNRPGVGGTLGPSTMAQTAAPDGYTLAVLPGTLFRMPHVSKVTWDPIRDFSYVIGLTSYTFGIAVPSDSPFRTLGDLVAHAKANPGKLTYGTSSRGGTGHVAMERLSKAAGMKMTLVPFKGAAEFMAALVGGHIDVVGDAGWGTMARAGRARMLAVMTKERLPGWPNVPTLRELGYDITALSMLGIGGPKGMDPAIVRTLHDAFRKASKDPAFIKMLEMDNQPEIYLDTEAYRRYAVETFEADGRFIRELGISLE